MKKLIFLKEFNYVHIRDAVVVVWADFYTCLYSSCMFGVLRKGLRLEMLCDEY